MSIRLFFVAAIMVSMSAALSLAQPPTVERREAMKKLEFLVGSWKGEGWMEHGPGQRRTFRGVEIVQLKSQNTMKLGIILRGKERMLLLLLYSRLLRNVRNIISVVHLTVRRPM